MSTHIFLYFDNGGDALTGPWMVEFEYSPPINGERESTGAQVSPDDDEAIEVLSVTDTQGNELLLDPHEERRIKAACWKQVKGGRL